MPNVFTGQEIVRNLSEGKLKDPIVKVGMAKKAEDSSDAILFADGGSCDDWISVPVSVMEQVTFLRNVSCRDHQHPLVMIQFKEPDPKNPTASVFAELARRNARTNPIQPGTVGTPQTVAQRADGGGFGGGAPEGIGGLECIAWHRECGWKTLYISSLNLNIPIYVCWNVCDTWGIR